MLCRYNVNEFGLGKIIFACTDSTEIFFSKLRSAGLNYNLPSFFTDSYCAGVSNKHCLLTFFIVSFQFISGTRVDHKQLEKTMTAAFLLEIIFISR